MEIKQRNPIIYLVSGKAKHGKDTFSAYLKETYENKGKKVIITQLAKYIKYYAREMTGWDLSEETKPREFLQQLGTNVIRQELKKNYLFINRMIEDIEIFSYFFDVIIISDVRLKKEIIDIKKVHPEAVAIKMNRIDFDNGLTDEQKKHPTEIDLDDFNEFDEEIVNTTLELLKKSAEDLYTKMEKGV